MATFEALQNKVAPARVVDVLSGTDLEELGRRYEFGLYVIHNLVDPELLGKWQWDSHEMFRLMEDAYGGNAVKVRRFYSTVRAVTGKCTCNLGYYATASRPVVNLPDVKCGVLWDAFHWIHDKLGNLVQPEKLWFNEVVANRYVAETEHIPWNWGASALFGPSPMMLSVTLGPAPVAFCFAPRLKTELGRHWADKAALIAAGVRGMLPLYPGDVMIACGSFHDNFVQKTLPTAAITPRKIESFPAVNTSIAPLVESLQRDVHGAGEKTRVVMDFRRIVEHTPECQAYRRSLAGTETRSRSRSRRKSRRIGKWLG